MQESEDEFVLSFDDDDKEWQPQACHVKALSLQVEELAVWHAVTQLAHQHQQRYAEDDKNDSRSAIINTMEQLESILSQATAPLPFLQRLAQQEYFQWQAYYQSQYKQQLQRLLQQCHYPQAFETDESSSQRETTTLVGALQDVCSTLHRLAASGTRLARHLHLPRNNDPDDIVVRELMRPWVERIVFHFVTYDTQRPTTFRTDRLPEWLFQYAQKHIFDTNVWDFVQTVLSSTNSVLFLQELVRLLQYVLAERNVFRGSTKDDINESSSASTKPVVLMKHIEQLLLFDWKIKQMVEEELPTTTTKVRRLMDVFVVGDEELLDWWLHNEQQTALETLEEEEEDGTPTSMTSRAEYVCARFRSMQRKASLLSLRGVYVSTVMAPFSTRLLDVWQDKATHLPPIDYTAWSEWIQGTHLFVDFLQQHQEQQQQDNQDDETNDLLRFATSLQGLEDAVVEDMFAKTLVERVLLNDAKLAAYLMRSSFQVSSNDHHSPEQDDTVELTEVRHVLTQFHLETVHHQNAGPLQEYAFRRMRESILSLLAEQFLQVALNADGMTLELAEQGSLVFAQHVQSVLEIFPTELLPLTARRLLDVTRWMSMKHTELSGIGNALCGLAGLPAPLTMEPFEQDDRLAEEAMAMIQAKGFVWMKLGDTISILNRRIGLWGG